MDALLYLRQHCGRLQGVGKALQKVRRRSHLESQSFHEPRTPESNKKRALIACFMVDKNGLKSLVFVEMTGLFRKWQKSRGFSNHRAVFDKAFKFGIA
ncbi:MAG: hypothetical protein LBT59_16765 [Clostridiales bacterium]|nr:hypothetical protein [Clostridiales bacterium]